MKKSFFFFCLTMFFGVALRAQIPTDLCDLHLGSSCCQEVSIICAKNGLDCNVVQNSDFANIMISSPVLLNADYFCLSDIESGFDGDAVFKNATIFFYKNRLWKIVCNGCLKGGELLEDKLIRRFQKYAESEYPRVFDDGRVRIEFDGNELSIVSLYVSNMILTRIMGR